MSNVAAARSSGLFGMHLYLAETSASQKPSDEGAPLFAVQVDGVVIHQFVISYFCFMDFATNSASNTKPLILGFSLKHRIVVVVVLPYAQLPEP